jgi:acetyl-CoA synthetase
MGFAGDIWPVHPNKARVGRFVAYRSVADLPGVPDAAYLAVNREFTIDIVGQLAERRAGGAICFATGFSESGADGVGLQQRLLDASGDMPLLGPNCYGMANYVDGAMLWPDEQGGKRVERGAALVCMSSNLAFNLTMQRRGLPVAHVVSLGNRLKFDLHDAVRELARLPSVTVLGLHIESIRDPSAFVDAVRFAHELGKPVVALKVGRSEVARNAVLSHTAAISGSDDLVSALFDRAGVARVYSPEHLVESLKLLHVAGPLDGGKLGAVTTSGGDASLLGDALEGTTLSLPALGDGACGAVRQVVHPRVEAGNPLDYQMFDWNDRERLQRTFEAFLQQDFDFSLCMLDYPREDRCDVSAWLTAEHAFSGALESRGTRGAVVSVFADNLPEAVCERLVARGVAPLAGIDAAVAAVQAAATIGQAWRREAGGAPLLSCAIDGDEAPVVTLDEAESKAMLRGHCLIAPPSGIAGNADEAAWLAASLGFPVALKALGLAHKTDQGGVRLNLGSAAEVREAFEEMRGLCDRVLVERMIEGVVAELIVGAARDDQFGLHLVIGAGGELVEVLDDTCSLLLPLSRQEARRALLGLRCAPLFRGYRGRPAGDVEAAVDAIMQIAGWVGEHAATLHELDVNPLLMLAEGRGAVVADAMIRMSAAGVRSSGKALCGQTLINEQTIEPIAEITT